MLLLVLMAIYSFYHRRTTRLFYVLAQVGDFRDTRVFTHSPIMTLGRGVDMKPTLPHYFKYKEKHLVPIRSQGQCASCWAFAVCDMIADRVSLATRGRHCELLSVQELVSCFRPRQFTCATGGIPELAYYYPMIYGLVHDRLYPYTQEHSRVIEPCQVPKAVSLQEAVWQHKDIEERYPQRQFVELGSNRSLCVEPGSMRDILRNITNMKTEIFLNGPIVGTLHVYDDLYQYDAESIYKVSPGARFKGGHAIEIFGWADKGSNTEESGFQGAYWICRNSWGKRWPKHMADKYGWFYVAMGVNEAGIESRASSCKPLMTHQMKEMTKGVVKTDVAYTSYTAYVTDPERHNFFQHLQRRRDASRRQG